MIKQEMTIDVHPDVINNHVNNLYLHFPRGFPVAFLRLGSVNDTGDFCPRTLLDDLEKVKAGFKNINVKISKPASLILQKARTPVDSFNKL